MNETPYQVDSLSLRVAEASSRDTGRTIARIDPDDMKKLDLSIGDVIEVRGTRTTAAKVLPAFAADRTKSLILIDGLVRANCGATLDGRVTIRKTNATPANTLILTPLADSSSPDANNQNVQGQLYMKHTLEGVVVRTGDLLRVNFLGNRFQEFVVQETVPKSGALVIGPATALKFSIIRDESHSRPIRRSGSGVTYEDIGGLSRQPPMSS